MSAVEEPLSPERLEVIRVRAEAATAGPWWVYEEEVCAEIVSEGTWIARNDGPDGQDLARVNAKFIAAAREDVPLLVAEVDWLAAELADARARVAELEGTPAAAPVLAPPIGSPMSPEQFFLAVQDGDTVTAETPRFPSVLHGLVHSLWPERSGCTLDNLANARTYGLNLTEATAREMRFTIHRRTGGAS